MTVSIREFQPADWPALWPILRAVFRRGDTYTYPPEATEEEIHALWVGRPEATFVACNSAGQVIGTYYLRPNQQGNASHVCNCGYVVAEAARGAGVAAQMCAHSQVQALERGYLAMQFNFVVSTNAGAVRLWERLGYSIVGTLPRAFRHPQEGLVDAHVMYKWLAPEPAQ
ncbi:N-acetyltransferase family protein [Luteimonas sp. A478]